MPGEVVYLVPWYNLFLECCVFFSCALEIDPFPKVLKHAAEAAAKSKSTRLTQLAAKGFVVRVRYIRGTNKVHGFAGSEKAGSGGTAITVGHIK